MAKINVVFSESKGKINRDIYGHFTEHIGGVFYDGLWVGEGSEVENVRGFRKALVDSFKKLNPPVLRWPGGCYAETYDWRDGIGPREQRPARVNWWYSHDKRIESNAVGTHEFMDLCRQVGAEPYFAANMTSTTPLEIRNWVEYCNFPSGTALSDERAKNGDKEPFGIQYWGIGNENWGGGGQMTPEQCAREYARYSTVANSIDKGSMKFIMCGPNGHDVDWTSRLMKEWASKKWHEAPTYGMSVHYYCSFAGDPVAFTKDEWYQQLHQANYMKQVLDDHRAAMMEYDPDMKIGLVVDEWGCWHKDGSGPSKGYNLFEQQSTMRDAVVAALTLNIFNDRCDSVVMANVAQLVNNLHSLYLTSGEKFIETPNYHVFEMYKDHMDAKQLHVVNGTEQLAREGFRPMQQVSVSASEAQDGSVLITLANLEYDKDIEIELGGVDGLLTGQAEIKLLQGETPQDHNDFEHPTCVKSVISQRAFKDGDTISLPAASVMAIKLVR
ncbi:alpha-N-arabinofuranosidase [Eubacteriales bacterium OttesenSCG-928-N13]|nr:alpha-N-arabinofuranosidase [Eubacteriales bacterium OttesenSCG-928-N13]